MKLRRIGSKIFMKLKRILKHYLFPAGAIPRRVRFGYAKGLYLLLDRRHALQLELGLAEKETHRIYVDHVKRDSVVYDVGAATGEQTIPFARIASGGKVIALEPSTESGQQLTQNAALNAYLSDRIQLVRAFVGCQETGTSSAAHDGEIPPVVTIDHLVHALDYPKPNFIKVDVDGAEEEVIRGMSSVLLYDRPVVLVETHSADLEYKCNLHLETLGYITEIIYNAWWRIFLPEQRPIAHNRWLLAVPLHPTQTHD